MLEAALQYAASGRRVHPCRPDNKRPLTKWGETATADAAEVEKLWRRWPDALIGFCTGDGVVVVDDDRGLAQPDSDLLDTLTARTRSRGYHHYFADPGGTIGCGVGVIRGIDIRGNGGYVIAPPSPGWEWLNDAPILHLPDFIADAMDTSRTITRYGGGFEPSTRVAEGGRNDYMARFAGYVIRLGFDDAAELVALCQEHNAQVCVPPLDDREVVATARSILRRHERS